MFNTALAGGRGKQPFRLGTDRRPRQTCTSRTFVHSDLLPGDCGPALRGITWNAPVHEGAAAESSPGLVDSRHALRIPVRRLAGDVGALLAPAGKDYFIFKPKHSGFYGTPLAELLQSGNVQQLVLTGTTSHQCVLFTAMDAYVRNYKLVTPADCLGAPTAAQTRHALFILKDALHARTGSSSALVFTKGTKLDSAGVSD
jgi:hypothetical protein